MDYNVISPIPYFKEYLELIFENDDLWENFQTYVRECSSKDRDGSFYEFHRDAECLEIWRQMIDNMGGGWPLTLFASAAFLLLAYKDSGHDLDAELQKLRNAPIRIVQGNIAYVPTECMVNAANRQLNAGDGVCGAIFDAAGKELMTVACQKIGSCSVGSAVVTPGFGLPAVHVIHAVGPKIGVDDNPSELLRSTYLSVMDKVRELGCHKVTIPLISAGKFNKLGWSSEAFWDIAISSIHEYQMANPDYPIYVIFVSHNPDTVKAGKKALSLFPNSADSFLFFWHEYEENGCFSQWYHAPFTLEGITYQTCEQYMMAKKALLFKDYIHYDAIMNEPDPKKDKALGKAVVNYDSALWHSCNEEIVFTANLAKFSQHPELKAALLATGDKKLAEASPYDKIYGIGLEASDPAAKDPRQWKGSNLLGVVLGHVRESLK